MQETVTVTGESPIVDTSTTTLGTNFTRELLTEIPNARDVWAAMAQAPGLQMTAYDVGGSRTGNQTGYRTYGFDDQNQTRLEGIDTTESTSANAGYFDFGSFEEFQVGGAGADASAYAGGAVLSISVKSGGDRFSGNRYNDWEGDTTISDNVPDYLRVASQPNEDGFYVREALTRGNPVDRQYDINFNLGGPIWKGKAWWFTSWRLNDQYKYTLGSDLIERSKLSNKYTLKGTFQLTRNRVQPLARSTLKRRSHSCPTNDQATVISEFSRYEFSMWMLACPTRRQHNETSRVLTASPKLGKACRRDRERGARFL